MVSSLASQFNDNLKNWASLKDNNIKELANNHPA